MQDWMLQILGKIKVDADGVNFNNQVDAFERVLLLRALEFCEWNYAKTARLLKIKRTTLLGKLEKKGIEKPTDPKDDDWF